jgi:hypothetical protein
MKWSIGIAIAALFVHPLNAKAETSRLEFVKEFVRELETFDRCHTDATKEMKTANSSQQQLYAGLAGSTHFISELQLNIRMLSAISLNKPFDALAPSLSQDYAMMIGYHQKLMELSKTFLSKQDPKTDYGALGARAPQIRASLEDNERFVFDATPLVFGMLISDKPDKNGHASRLIITRSEGKQIVDELNLFFGDRMKQKNQNFFVSSATVLRAYFKKGFKFSDDPD